jgi:hypothetical protein
MISIPKGVIKMYIADKTSLIEVRTGEGLSTP